MKNQGRPLSRLPKKVETKIPVAPIYLTVFQYGKDIHFPFFQKWNMYNVQRAISTIIDVVDVSLIKEKGGSQTLHKRYYEGGIIVLGEFYFKNGQENLFWRFIEGITIPQR
jgi:hypothetical protein